MKWWLTRYLWYRDFGSGICRSTGPRRRTSPSVSRWLTHPSEFRFGHCACEHNVQLALD